MLELSLTGAHKMMDESNYLNDLTKVTGDEHIYEWGKWQYEKNQTGWGESIFAVVMQTACASTVVKVRAQAGMGKEMELKRLWSPTRASSTRVHFVKTFEVNPKMEAIDAIIAKMNKRFRYAAIMIYCKFPFYTNEQHAEMMGVSERTINRRKEAIINTVNNALNSSY